MIPQALAVAISAYCGSPYDAVHPRVAEPSRLVPASVVGGHSCGTDCSTMITGLLGRYYDGLVAWPTSAYARCQVQDPAEPWSAVEVWVEARLGIEADSLDPGAVYVAQGWRSLAPLSGGHQFLLHAGRRLHASSSAGRVLWQSTTLESLRATYPAGLRVVRLR